MLQLAVVEVLDARLDLGRHARMLFGRHVRIPLHAIKMSAARGARHSHDRGYD